MCEKKEVSLNSAFCNGNGATWIITGDTCTRQEVLVLIHLLLVASVNSDWRTVVAEEF